MDKVNSGAGQTGKKRKEPDLSEELYFSEGGFLFDSTTGLTYTMNKTGAFVFNELKKGMDEPLIIQSLMERFDVDEIKAKADIKDFKQQLRDFGLIQV